MLTEAALKTTLQLLTLYLLSLPNGNTMFIISDVIVSVAKWHSLDVVTMEYLRPMICVVYMKIMQHPGILQPFTELA